MPITNQDLISFRNEKIKQKEEFEIKKQSYYHKIEEEVKKYRDHLMQDFNNTIIKEGDRLDAEVNFLDYLIQAEQSQNTGEVI